MDDTAANINGSTETIVSSEQALGSESVDAGVVPTSEPAQAFELPEQLRDHKVFEGMDSWEKVTGRLDWLHDLRSKKGIPEENSPEAWGKFVEGLGDHKEILADLLQRQPEVPQEYKFTDIEGYEDNGETDKFFNEMFKKYGIDQDRADNIRKDTIENFLEYDRAHKAFLGKQFADMAKEEFGDNWEAELAGPSVKFKELYPDEVSRKMVEATPNEVLIPIFKYIKQAEDAKVNFNGEVGNRSINTGLEDSQLMARYKELHASKMQGGRHLKAFNDFNAQNRARLAKLFNLTN